MSDTKRLLGNDRGVTLSELVMVTAITMIGFVAVAATTPEFYSIFDEINTSIDSVTGLADSLNSFWTTFRY